MNVAESGEVTVSTILYWSMIEAGLAMIATCLPALQFLVRKISLDRMISSVRSAFSLQSTPSQHSKPTPTGRYSNVKPDSKAALVTTMVRKGDVVDDLVMGSMASPTAEGDVIYVTNHLSQHNDMV